MSVTTSSEIPWNGLWSGRKRTGRGRPPTRRSGFCLLDRGRGVSSKTGTEGGMVRGFAARGRSYIAGGGELRQRQSRSHLGVANSGSGKVGATAAWRIRQLPGFAAPADVSGALKAREHLSPGQAQRRPGLREPPRQCHRPDSGGGREACRGRFYVPARYALAHVRRWGGCGLECKCRCECTFKFKFRCKGKLAARWRRLRPRRMTPGATPGTRRWRAGACGRRSRRRTCRRSRWGRG